MSASGDAREVGGGLDPGERGVAVRLAEAALGHCAIQVARDPVAAGFGARDVRLIQRDRQADRRVHLGDAVTHQPGPGHEDALISVAMRSMVRGARGPCGRGAGAGFLAADEVVRRYGSMSPSS